MKRINGPLSLWGLVFGLVLAWSAWQPADRFIWWLEALPAMLGAVLLLVTRVSFPLTPLLYVLILLHCIVLLVGAHYTYAEVPLFDAIKPLFGFERNNYDKLGHIAQGLVPAILAREILIRLQVVAVGGWRNLFIVSICLAFSAFYELIEWAVAVTTGESAEAFLGTQGDPWDTQTDMAMALGGAIAALMLLSRWHDRQLNELNCNEAR